MKFLPKNLLQKNPHYVLAFGHLCSDVNQGTLSAVLPFLVAAHNYDYATAATLVMAANILNSLIQPFFGCIADKHGRPYYMVIGIMLAGGGMSLTGLLDNFYGLCAALMISGVGIAMFHPQAAQLVNKYSDAQSKGAKMGIFSFGGNLGFTLGPILASASIAAFGLHGTLIFLLPPLLFAIVATLAFAGHRAEAANARTTQAVPEPQTENWGAFGRLSLLIISRSIMYNGINTFLVLYLVEAFALPKEFGNTFLSCYYAITAFSALFGGKLADAYGNRKILRLSFGLYLPAIALFAVSQNLIFLLLLLLPMGMGIGLCYSPMVLLGQLYLPRHTGFASGVTLGLAVSIGGIVSPLLGKIGDAYGLCAIFWVLCALAVLPLTISFLLPEPPARNKTALEE